MLRLCVSRVKPGDHVLCVLFRAPSKRDRLLPAALRVAGSGLDVPMPRAISPSSWPALASSGHPLARACMALAAPAVTCAARRGRADESEAKHWEPAAPNRILEDKPLGDEGDV